jgi:2-dehydro-3-deoxyphosphogalactonate aldolase
MSKRLPFPGIPVLAVLRGISPDDILAIADQLIEHDIRRIEVTLNSPNAMHSIELLLSHYGNDALIGAGTVLDREEVNQLADIGCEIVVSPNLDLDVVAATKEKSMLSCPGVFTPSEAFAALKAGADILKYFPADLCGPAAIKAWRAVLPKDTNIVATGGTNADTLSAWLSAGVDMIGVGNALYKPGDSTDDVARKAAALAKAYKEKDA